MAAEGFPSRLRRARIVRVLVAYLAASWLLLQVTSLFVQQLGLPAWFVPAAVVLLAIGLLILVATAWVQSHPSTVARAGREEVPGAWEVDLGDVRESVAEGRLPHLTWGRALLGGVVAFSLLFGIAGALVLLRDGTSPLGPREAMAGPEPGLAVLPFRVVGADADLWREGMVDLLSTNLDGAVGLRTIAPRTVLSRWHGAIGGEGEPTDERALEVARDVGARHALLGTMVSLGGEVRLSARVHDLSTGRVEGEAQVRGHPDSVPALVDRLSIEVLRATPLARPGRTAPDLRSITTSSLEALKAYLAGERHFRRSRWEEARIEFTRAVEADSTFALALYRLSQTFGWLAFGTATQEYGERAARFAHKLPEREALLVQAYAHENWSGTIGALEPFTRSYPDDVEGWYQLGDALYHGGRQSLLTDDRFRAALARAVELDPGFGPAYVHLIEDAFVREDSADVTRLEARQARIDPTSREARATELARRLAWDDEPPELGTFPSELLEEVVGPLGWTAAYWRRTLAVAEHLLRPGQPAGGREVAHRVTVRIAWYRGKFREAGEMLLSAEGAALLEPFGGERAGPRIVLAVSLLGLDSGELAARAAASLSEPPAAQDRFLLGARAAREGRWAEYDAQLRALETGRQGTDTLGVDERGLPLALRGWGAAARGDRRSAIRDLETALPEIDGGCPGPSCFLHSVLRHRVGELLLEEDDARGAEPYLVSVRDYLPSSVLAWLELGRVYEQLDDLDEARRHYARVVRDLEDADPALRPLAEEARGALRRLQGLKRL